MNELVSIEDIELGVIVNKENDTQLMTTYDADFARCPMCESRKINYGEPEPDNVFIYRTHTCDDCGTTWEERYDLVRVNIEPGDLTIIEKLL